MKKISFVIFFLSLISFDLIATEFNIDKTKSNEVKFISDAPIEDFEGITNLIDGYIYWEGEDMTSKSQMYFEVDLNTIDTGIGLRNRHMRENYLETDKWQYATYKGMISSIKKNSENNYEVEVKGTMSIHGVSRSQTIQGKITRNGNVMRIQSQFYINLNDHKIDIPKFMFLKINEIMDMRLDFYLKEKQ